MAADTPALAAFAALRREQRGAVGVTAAPGGPLLGNLSVSDLRGLRPERWGALALPVRPIACSQTHVMLFGHWRLAEAVCTESHSN